jgi:hypothetical protein
MMAPSENLVGRRIRGDLSGLVKIAAEALAKRALHVAP